MQSCTIELHTCPLAQLQPKDMSIPKNRTEQITQQKQQIYAYRNQLLTQHLGCAIQQLVFAKHALGKPYLSSHTLAFNHSHSKQHYALALSDTMQDLGVDIEDLNRKVRFDALAQHAFHPEEYQQWVSLDCDPLFWFKVWTCKEAVLKASGFGIRLSAREGVVEQDLHLIGYALEAGRSMVIAINKWDNMSEYDRTQCKLDVDRRFDFIPWPKYI